WVSHLITAKTKYTLAHQSVPDREEDCYSETEAEDPDEEPPRHGCDSVSGPMADPGKGMEDPRLTFCPPTAISPQGSPRPCSPMDPTGEDFECLMQCLKQGGVSLIGRQRFLTQEQCRKYFIRRNKNPLSCTRSCGSGGLGGSARTPTGHLVLSTAPLKRQTNPDT
ncbi:Connector enhancer of kinase suppressor of ras 1, partial [Tauraco erythrolophus]